MSVMKRTVSAGLVALTLAGALVAAAPAAEARDYYRHHNNNLWPGVAAGVAGGIIGGAIIAGAQRPVYVEPGYDYAPPPPPPPVYYQRAYYDAPPPPVCHYEWTRNGWGEAYRVRVCPGY